MEGALCVLHIITYPHVGTQHATKCRDVACNDLSESAFDEDMYCVFHVVD